eukprot:scaffold236557_cov28-Tisochrysis_lutea.AAC.2
METVLKWAMRTLELMTDSLGCARRQATVCLTLQHDAGARQRKHRRPPVPTAQVPGQPRRTGRGVRVRKASQQPPLAERHVQDRLARLQQCRRTQAHR